MSPTSPPPSTLKTLGSNLRFYVLLSTLCISLLVPSWLRLETASDQLWLIRTEQVFGYLSLLYWYIALMISPISRELRNQTIVKTLTFSRRAIGVSAAFFALLHVAVSLWGQLGGLDGVLLLPEKFTWALLFGLIALIILSLMAATSFNKVIAFMTPKRWKLLHRLTYLGGLAVLLHLWIIGTHVAYSAVKLVIFLMLAGLFYLESKRIAITLEKKYPKIVRASNVSTITTILWLVLTALLLILPQFISTYNDNHALQPSRTEQRIMT